MRRGSRAERSETKVEDKGIVEEGMRVSEEIVARRPRWEGEETRVLKAECSSWEAEVGVWG